MKSKVFTVMVVGDNPDELMAKYNEELKVKPYKKFEFSKSKEIYDNEKKLLSTLLTHELPTNIHDYFKDKLKLVNNMSYREYFEEITTDMNIDSNGDAWTDENPDGKWNSYKMGDNFSLPLKLINGDETRTALNKDIDWDSMHLVNTKLYEVVWSLVKGKRKPQNDNEKLILNNMSSQVSYFSNFKNVDEYVSHNCSYWNYAYLDKDGWVDMDDSSDDKEWVANFYDTYVEKLKPNDRVTIFECTRKDGN